MSLPRFQSLNPISALPQLLAVLGSRKPQNNGLSPQGSWYSIRNVSQTEAEIQLYNEIGDYGITAAEFNKELAGIKASEISLRINSGGGDVFDAVAIASALRRHPANITAYVDGIAASAASFIAMAADKVLMSPNATMMIHDAAGLCMGPADSMREMADTLDKASDNIASIYAKRAGGTVGEWRDRMKQTTWLSDHEAVSLGLADGIDGEEPTKPVVKNREVPKAAFDWAKFINEQEDALVA